MKNLSIEAINELRRNARSVVRELGLLNDAYFEIGVTLAERHLLIELTTSTMPTMGEIADRLLLDKSTISRLITKSVKKGFVDCVTDSKDKRKRFLQITKKGRDTLNAFEPIAFNQTKHALATLTQDEIETIYKGVSLYAKGLRSSRIRSSQSQQESNLKIDREIESWPEIITQLSQLGYSLDLFEQKDEKDLYEIFREVVEAGSQFPYECSSIEEFRRQFFTPQGKVYVCHSLQGEVVGGFFLRANYSGRANHIANSAYMIRKKDRGKGIGSLLIKASLHLAKKQGFKAMQYNLVLSQNPLAVKLYERLGFNIIGTIPHAIRNADGTSQDAHIMHRKIENNSETI